MNAAAVERILADGENSGAARRRHSRPCDDRGLARQRRRPRHHRHRGGARSGAGEGSGAHFPGRVAVGLDARDGKVAVEGWAETSELSALDIARRFEDAGVAAIIYTDVARDGMLKGLNLDATIALAEAISIPVIASGGLASLDDVRALAGAAREKLAGAIAGRALYDGGSTPLRRSQLQLTRGANGGLICSRFASFPASTSKTAESSRASISSICATPAIRSRRPSPMTPPAPTS